MRFLIRRIGALLAGLALAATAGGGWATEAAVIEVGAAGSAFSFQPVGADSASAQDLVFASTSTDPIRWVKIQPNAHPDKGATLKVTLTAGQTVEIATKFPVVSACVADGKVYTCERLALPCYRELLARADAAAAKNEGPKPLTGYVDTTQLFYRVYDPADKAESTVLEGPLVKGQGTLSDLPFTFFVGSDALVLVYRQYQAEKKAYDLLVVNSPMGRPEAATTTTLAELSFVEPPRQLQLKAGELMMIRTPNQGASPAGAAPVRELVRVNLASQQVVTLMKSENLASYAVDGAQAKALAQVAKIYAPEPPRPDELFVKLVSLTDAAAQPLVEKLPAEASSLSWDAQQNCYRLWLPESAAANSGWQYLKLNAQ